MPNPSRRGGVQVTVTELHAQLGISKSTVRRHLQKCKVVRVKGNVRYYRRAEAMKALGQIVKSVKTKPSSRPSGNGRPRNTKRSTVRHIPAAKVVTSKQRKVAAVADAKGIEWRPFSQLPRELEKWTRGRVRHWAHNRLQRSESVNQESDEFVPALSKVGDWTLNLIAKIAKNV